MTNEEILEKQVEALEKLLQLRTAIIEDLEQRVESLKMDVSRLSGQQQWSYPGINITPHVYTPYPFSGPGSIMGGMGAAGGGSSSSIVSVNTCPATGQHHEYPSNWNSISSQVCTRCGAQLYSNPNTAIVGAATQQTTGLVQQVDSNSTTQTIAGNVFTLTNVAK